MQATGGRMKLCFCGGRFYRKGQNQTRQGGVRFRCRECGALITVRDDKVVGDGKVQVVPWVSLGSPRRPECRDWRHV